MKSRKKLLNQFRWSFSRETCFKECKRKYWYTYYGSWEGWPKTPYDTRITIDPLAAYLYARKQMQTLPAFVGSVVHTVLESALKKKIMGFSLPNEVELTHEALALFQKGVQEAMNEMWRIHPKKHLSLYEWYYQKDPPSSEELQKLEDKITLLIRNWYRSPIREKLLEHPQATCKGVEEMIEFKLDASFPALAIPALAIIDCIIEWKKNSSPNTSQILLFDWKTGSEKEEIIQQLTAYALAIHTTWKTPLNAITLIPFYIGQGPHGYKKYGEGQEQTISPEQIRLVTDQIRSSCQEMMPHHVDEGTPPLEAFPCTDERACCRYCPFVELCSATEFKPMSRTHLQEDLLTLHVGTRHVDNSSPSSKKGAAPHAS